MRTPVTATVVVESSSRSRKEEADLFTSQKDMNADGQG